MPTDDDYGRRERLLLHQHTATQFGPTASPSSQSQAQPAHTHSHPHPHSYSHGHGHGNVQNPGASPPGGPGGLTAAADRYLQDRVGQAEEHAATARYGAAGNHRQLHERYNNNNEKPSEQQQQLPPVDGSYGGQGLLQDRYPQLPGLQNYQHQFAGSPGVAGRLGLGGERFGHRYGEQHHASGFHLPGPGFDEGRYANPVPSPGPGPVLLSSELFPSPPSPAPASDRFIPPPPLSPTPSEKYASSGSLAAAAAAAATTPAAKERFLGGASPVLRPGQGLFTPGIQPGKEPSRYGLCGLPTLAGLSSASPVHGPLTERFACSPRVGPDKSQPSGSPRHERSYHHLQESQRYLTSSPNPEGAHQRYATAGTESTQTACRRLSGTEHAVGSPGSCAAHHQELQPATGQIQRYAGATVDRFGDILAQRYGQARADRYAAAEHLTTGERLLSSGSPTAVPVSRYHATTPGYANGASQTSPCGDHHGHGFSPTGDPRYGSPTAPTKNPEKYLATQTSKALPAGSYNSDRYQVAGGQNQAQERASRLDRFHRAGPGPGPPTDPRYSPGRSTGEKSYQLSLPKPKDRFPSTGRVVAPGAERAYASAHTPVERYVPQPPAEILYPGYVDLYVPPAAHTPADRYVPATDPGDPYMRRDLGFHHHYRLPPPGYPYHHQAHYRGFRGFAYAAPPPPARLGGSPGSSSSASSTNSTAQREFSTSPLLRPKARGSAVEFQSQQQPRYAQPSHGQCCPDNNNQAHQGQRGCCPPSARHLLPSCSISAPVIPAQNNPHASWQPSPSSGTTSTSTVSSSGQEGGVGTSQSISMYAVGAVGTGNGSGSSNGDGNGNGSKISESLGNHSTTTSPSVPLTTTGNFNLARSASAPTGPRPVVTAPSFISQSNENQNQRLQRTMSRTEAIKSYIRRETATFFGVDEDSETQEKQRWLERRRRMASRKYGALLPEHRPPDPDITRDVPDFADIPEGVTLRRWHQPVRRKDSVARMTLSGLSYMVTTMTRHRPRERDETRPESRSFPPGTAPPSSAPPEVSNDEEEERFFEKPAPPSPASTRSSEHPTGRQDDAATLGSAREDESAATLSDLVDAPNTDRDTSEELVRFTAARDEGAPTTEILNRRPRQISKDRYTSRMSSWRRSREPGPGTTGQASEAVTLRRQAIGGTRISPNTIDRIFDNSNRRQYGMGIVGRFFGRSFRKSVAHKPDVKKQLDDIEDQRPFFTYWITTVQVLILVISLACYGFGPFGFELNHRSGLVLVTSLSLQQVDYQEPANFWIGPRAADLIHLGAKFAPCMRRDIKILKEIDVWRERERDTACCIRNDDSGCVQSSKQDCSNTISTWKKWGPGDSGPGGRISGSVCGLDPKFCDAPASVAPYEWPDDITKWPICRKTNPFNQRFSKGSGNNQNTFPIGRHMDKMAEHMVCEVIGHPCCIGIHGMCRITTKEYCDFVHGYFHEEASLCSQVECLHDVCGMIPFLHPEWPDQFYRLFTSIFLHAGIFHLFITLCVQYFFMRDLEKLTGSLRIGIIYFTGGLAGNLASAIFVPYRAEVGPAGAHFALLATLVVEVLNSWPMLKHPRRALAKLLGSLLALLLLGALPWIDNYAHLFGFVFGFLAAYAVMPFISFGKYDRRRKVLLIWVCLVLIIGLFAMLLALFYNVPAYECEVCKLFTCIPFTKDFCASQNINFKKEEPV